MQLVLSITAYLSEGFPGSSVGKESACNAGDPDCRVNSWVGKICWRRDRLPTPVFLGFPCGSAGKESACNAGDLGSIPGLGRSPEEGKGYPLHLFWPREFHRLYSSWGHKELDTTEQFSLSLINKHLYESPVMLSGGETKV